MKQSILYLSLSILLGAFLFSCNQPKKDAIFYLHEEGQLKGNVKKVTTKCFSTPDTISVNHITVQEFDEKGVLVHASITDMRSMLKEERSLIAQTDTSLVWKSIITKEGQAPVEREISYVKTNSEPYIFIVDGDQQGRAKYDENKNIISLDQKEANGEYSDVFFTFEYDENNLPRKQTVGDAVVGYTHLDMDETGNWLRSILVVNSRMQEYRTRTIRYY